MTLRRWRASMLAAAVAFAALAAMGHGPLAGSSTAAAGSTSHSSVSPSQVPVDDAVSLAPVAAPRPVITRPDERPDRLFRIAALLALVVGALLVGRPRSTLHRLSDVVLVATQTFARRAPGRAPPVLAVH